MFTDLVVIELASVLAGPRVGQFFAELGATVIKVENPRTGGDVTRSWKARGEQTDDRSAYFCSVNWGKKSVALDLLNGADRLVLNRLVAKADIVISSYKPGDAEKLGVSYQKLAEIRPPLIYGQITGYGPLERRVGYDAVIQAEAGFMSMNGLPDGPPVKMPVALVDVLASSQLIQGLLLALLHRGQKGVGTVVEVSLLQSAVSAVVNQATNWLVNGQVPRRQGSLHPNIAPYGEIFRAADGKDIIVAVGTDKQFTSMCSILDLHSTESDPRFASNGKRVENRAGLQSILEEQFARFSSDALLARFHAENIPAGLVLTVDEVFTNDKARELVHVGLGMAGISAVAFTSPSFSRVSNLAPPPHLGEHTSEVVSWA